MGERSRNSRRTSGTGAAAKPVKTPTRDQERFASKQRTFCKNAIKEMLSDDNSVNFSKPVGELWDLSDLPDYEEKVPHPMDLGTVQEVLEARGYVNDSTGLFDPEFFSADVRRTFENALAYNEVGTDMYGIAERFLVWFEEYMRDLPTTSNASAPVAAARLTPPGPAPASTPEPEPKPEPEPVRESEPETFAAVEDRPTLHDELKTLRAERAQLASQLGEPAGALQSLQMADDDRVRLRDEVEELPWEKCKKVVEILQAHVDAALSSTDDPKPEFVDIDLNVVEPKLLFEIQEYLHPSTDSKCANILKKIAEIDAQLAALGVEVPGDPRPSAKKRDRSRDKRERDRKRRRR
jgi:hypothetical protein